MNASNLTDYSYTFVEAPLGHEIPVDSKLREIQKKFGIGNESVVLRGPTGSGKTTHLSQFARQFPLQSFTFFIGDDLWSSKQSSLLSSLCEQMSMALGIKIEAFESSIDLDRLKTIFSNLASKIIQQAKQNKTPYYFVVDALELSSKGVQGERIIDLFPLPSNSKWLFFLGSMNSASSNKMPFLYRQEEPHLFSSLETEKYLEESGLDQGQILKLHQISNGMPGYLSIIRALLQEKKVSVSQIMDTPSEIELLLKIQWETSSIEASEIGKNIFGLIAYSLTPLNVLTMAEMLNVDKGAVERCLLDSGLVKNVSGNVQFHNELLKAIARNQLRALEKQSLSAITQYYQQHIDHKDSISLLPEYYRQQKNYDALVELLVPDRFVSIVQESQGLSLVRKDLDQASEMAKDEKDLFGVLKYSVASSQLRALSNTLIGEREVRALVAMKRFEDALQLAYSSKIAELRIRLLAHIYLAMEKEGLTVSRQAINELEQMVQSIKTEIDPEQELVLAADLFPLMPDIATSLVERAEDRENARNAIDLVRVLASIQSSDDSAAEQLVERIENINLKEIALLNAPWLDKLSVDKLLAKAGESRQTKAKVYLFRQWCLQNLSHPEIHRVISTALDVIINDPDDYKVPLRDLRQISEGLRICDINLRKELVGRFDIPKFTSLQSPVEERLRLDLNLAEAIFAISPTDAIDRFNAAYNGLLGMTLDTDVGCYCFTRVLVTSAIMDPHNNLKIKDSIKRKLEDEFIRLLDTSAEQLEISRRILRSLCLVDPDLALTFAELLNTLERRESGVRDVVISYVRQDRIKIDIEFIYKALAKIRSQNTREEAFLKMLSNSGTRNKIKSNTDLQNFFINSLPIIIDPIILCKCTARLLSIFDSSVDKERCQVLFSALLDGWDKIDVVWQKVEVGFDMVVHIASVSQSYGAELYERSKSLRNTSSLANQSIASIFFHLLGLAIRSVGEIDLSNQAAKSSWEQLLTSVDLLPSALLRTYLIARIALARLRQGDKTTFDSLLRDKVLPVMRSSVPSNLRDSITADIAPAIFEYSRDETENLLRPLPYVMRNNALASIAFHIMKKTNIEDSGGSEPPVTTIDTQCADKVLYLLERIERDQSLASVVSVFTRAIENPNSRFNESQRLDLLNKIENRIIPKLPDKTNISHEGYRIICQSAIERAMRNSAKRAKHEITRTRSTKIKQITNDAHNLKNIADKVLVLVNVAVDFRNIDLPLASRMLDEAKSLVANIPNTEDRIERLEIIAEGYSKLNNTSMAVESVKMAYEMANSLRGIERNTVLGSIIQTAHQLSPKIAANLTEKIEDSPEEFSLTIKRKSLELANSPQKLLMNRDDYIDDDVIGDAADSLLTDLLDGRGVTHPRNVLLEWINSVKYLDFQSAMKVANWVVETLMRQSTETESNTAALSIVNAAISNSELILALGNMTSFLSEIPTNLRQGFQSLSTTKRHFKVGERDNAIAWISEWLRNHAKEYVRICDPYFDSGQLWILQNISTDVEVKIVAADGNLGIKDRSDKTKIKSSFNQAWRDISNQQPPPTLVVVHSTIFGSEEDFHDRYITTADGGLSIGTSLNGLGSKEFFITVLTQDDVQAVDEIYISPKLDIQKHFSKTLYFEIE